MNVRVWGGRGVPRYLEFQQHRTDSKQAPMQLTFGALPIAHNVRSGKRKPHTNDQEITDVKGEQPLEPKQYPEQLGQVHGVPKDSVVWPGYTRWILCSGWGKWIDMRLV
jgi:hypothetical protein